MFSIKIPFKADSLLFDPDYQVISGNNTISSVNENEQQPKLRVYPNPARDRITFSVAGSWLKEEGKIYIYDHTGQLRDMIILTAGQTGLTLGTMNYASGLYFYMLTNKNFQISGKFLIIH